MTCTHGVSLMLPCPQCEADEKAHALRVSEEQQRAADARIVEYHQAMYGPSSEDSWPNELCEECGQLTDPAGDRAEFHEDLRRVLHPNCVGPWIGNHTPEEPCN